MSYADDPAGYRERLMAKLQPDVIRSTLAFGGLFQVTHEMLKREVLDKVREYHCLGLNADGSMTDAEKEAYRLRVLSLASDRFRASLLWLVQYNAITQAQADRLDSIYAHRHSLTHELVKYIVDPDIDPDVDLARRASGRDFTAEVPHQPPAPPKSPPPSPNTKVTLSFEAVTLMPAVRGTATACRAREVWFDIPVGSVPDMAYGGARNGMSNHIGTEYFRPQYFTVEFKDGRMAELRLWGRQIKKDGSLGVRHLDYLWQWGRP